MGQGGWRNGLTLGALAAAVVLSSSLAFDISANAVPTQWSVESSPSPDSTNMLDGVSCASSTVCLAVGTATGGGLIEQSNGSAWTAITDPGPSSDRLAGVSCVSTTFCDAVGSMPDDDEEPMIENWDGTTMTVVSSPTVAVGKTSGLDGVSCVSVTFCVAVGFTEFTPGAALIETWNGTAWSITSVPQSAAGNTDSLDSVSCTSDVACTAVGSAFTGSTVVPLAESWNGTTWSVAATPSPATNAEMLGVSCPSSSSCMAVGEILAADEPDQGPNQLFAESWNGTSWVASTIANASSNDGLLGVSCGDTTDCVAVGYGTSGSASEALIDAWDGTAWTTSTNASLQSTSSGLSAVTCTDPTDCVAVGNQDAASSGETLVEVGSSTAATTTTTTTTSTTIASSTTTTAPATTATTVAGGGTGSTDSALAGASGSTTGSGGSSLASTGIGTAAPWLVLAGVSLLVLGLIGRRRSISRMRTETASSRSG